MALQVWFPLNGDVYNQGLGKITSISTTPKYRENGKLFNLAIDLSKRVTFICPNLKNLQTFSIAFWAYVDNIESLAGKKWVDLFGFTDVSSSGSTGTFRFETCYDSSHGIAYYDNATMALSNHNGRTYTTVKNIWMHCCIVFDNINHKIYAYKNGMKFATDTHNGGKFNTNGTFYIGETNNIAGMLQDLRIYDHALSPKEVKEISKGLVLHLKLNNNDKIYDCSGYGNNGTIINSLTLDNTSPRYDNAIHFSATNQKIQISNLNVTGFSDSYTFSWWGKTSNYSTMFWGFSNGIRLNGIYLGNLWNTGDSSNNPLYKPGTTTQVTAPTKNVWHHFIMVGNGSNNTCKVYIDGELFGQAKTYKTISGTEIFINGWLSNTNYSSNNMSISDFRLYATALDDNEIKKLYNISGAIDNNGNLYIRELVE